MSRLLAWVLRHGVDELGLRMRGDGYVPVDALLARLGKRARGIDNNRVRLIVKECPKQRFSLVEELAPDAAGSGGLMLFIRANQGHTTAQVVAAELLLPIHTAVEAGSVVVHGTYLKYLAGPTGIAERGLNRMARHHVHFASGLPGDDDVRSGMRPGCTLLVYLDAGAALAAGLKLFMSANGVILCPGDAEGYVAPEFFLRVVNTQDGTELPLPHHDAALVAVPAAPATPATPATPAAPAAPAAPAFADHE